MEINKKNLRKISELSDKELKEKIDSVIDACGINKTAAAKYLGDMSSVRKKLNSLSDTQIRMMLNALGEENVQKIKEGLDNGSKR